MQIENAQINDCLRVEKVSSKFSISTFLYIYSNLTVKLAIFLKSRDL